MQDFKKATLDEQNAELSAAHKSCANYTPSRMCFQGNWDHITQAGSHLTTWDTGYSISDLRAIGLKSTELPEDFQYHSTLNRAHINKRQKMVATGKYTVNIGTISNVQVTILLEAIGHIS